jgi:hypothetical protein
MKWTLCYRSVPQEWVPRLRFGLGWGLAVLALLGGCRRATAPEPDSVTQTIERGPLKLTLAAGPRAPQVGDAVRVDLSVELPADYDVLLPQAKDLGGLGARELSPPESRPGPTGIIWRRSFTLEPLVSGPLEIPPLTVKYGRRAGPTDTQPALENELVSEPLKLEVRSALTAADKPEQPRDITGALLPPRPPRPWWHWALLAGAIAALIAVAYVGYQTLQRWRRRPAPLVLPEIWALRALAELASYDWIDRGQSREYYYRLTEIVREYIERKFGIAAPEMTTEEFLNMLARNRGALPCQADPLRDFLEACDYVKYAALQPRRADAEGALATARSFVHQTAAAPAGVQAA